MTAIALSSFPQVAPYTITAPPVNWSGINHARMTADMETLPGNPLRALMRLRRLVGDNYTIRIEGGVRGLAAFFDQSQGWIKQSLLLLQKRGYIHLSYLADGVTAITVLPPSALQATVLSFPPSAVRTPRSSTPACTNPVQTKKRARVHQDAEYGASDRYQSGTAHHGDRAHQDAEYGVSDRYRIGTAHHGDRAHQDAEYTTFGCTEAVHGSPPLLRHDDGDAEGMLALAHLNAENSPFSVWEQAAQKAQKIADFCTDLVQAEQVVLADCNARYEDLQNEPCTDPVQPISLESCKQQHAATKCFGSKRANTHRAGSRQSYSQRADSIRTGKTG